MGKGQSKGGSKGANQGKENSNKEPPPLGEPPEPAPPDPRLPLTARQKFSITKSWKGIARAMEPTGIDMFLRLFESHQDLLQLFEKFKELKSRESQRESLELAQHASLVMSTLDDSISSLDNVDAFIQYLHAVGKMHRRVPGFNRDYFWRIEAPFLEAVEETLGDRYTENIASIYKITIRFILETVIKGYDDAGS